LAVGFFPDSTLGKTRVTLKSAGAGSSYYMMMVQLSEMIKTGSNGEYLVTVEESQGSVQNVKQSKERPGNFVFTTPPSILALAREGKKPFEGTPFDNARALFPIPFVTMHFVVTQASGITSLSQLKGHAYIPGVKGSFCEERTKKILEILDLSGKVNMVDAEANAVNPAIQNGKVDGSTNCASHPEPTLIELATTTPVRILSLSEEERNKIIALDPVSGPLTIAAGTYKGQDQDVHTVGVPVGAYGTTNMSEEVAYFITKTFWDWKQKLSSENAWWKGVTPELITQMGVKLHPGSLRYYTEKGFKIPDAMR
jgi:uncharacterized protein